jgi:hypothetical protein
MAAIGAGEVMSVIVDDHGRTCPPPGLLVAVPVKSTGTSVLDPIKKQAPACVKKNLHRSVRQT